MFIVYIYDLKAKDKKKFNRVKRLFYYHMAKLPLKKEFWKSKSALAVPAKMEKIMDSFFKKFQGGICVFKLNTNSIEELD